MIRIGEWHEWSFNQAILKHKGHKGLKVHKGKSIFKEIYVTLCTLCELRVSISFFSKLGRQVMPAKFVLRSQEYEIRHGMTVADALKKLNLNPEALLATRAGELITDDEIVNEGDVIKLVAVISGG
jgi:sulfur carrier protein